MNPITSRREWMEIVAGMPPLQPRSMLSYSMRQYQNGTGVGFGSNRLLVNSGQHLTSKSSVSGQLEIEFLKHQFIQDISMISRHKGSTVTGVVGTALSSDVDSDTTKLWHMHVGHMSERGYTKSAYDSCVYHQRLVDGFGSNRLLVNSGQHLTTKSSVSGQLEIEFLKHQFIQDISMISRHKTSATTAPTNLSHRRRFTPPNATMHCDSITCLTIAIAPEICPPLQPHHHIFAPPTIAISASPTVTTITPPSPLRSNTTAIENEGRSKASRQNATNSKAVTNDHTTESTIKKSSSVHDREV
ncbi:hypothetical protein RJ639_015386 [Escallonia herrerae]|uniref:GAG-pre-integrase domain-containing protein n=1 Tax=Escallonia herrerae TaxID=1293975 RepID=A0AA88VHD2_9ASTE|nr:hypothetical protein RJ639_015386 [Escallonia herrerae]